MEWDNFYPSSFLPSVLKATIFIKWRNNARSYDNKVYYLDEEYIYNPHIFKIQEGYGLINTLLPVIKAMENSNIEIFKKILGYGINYDNVKENIGKTLLSHAATDKTSTEYLELIFKPKDDLNECGLYGMTAIHYATMFNGSIPIFDWLFKKGANINPQDNEGNTPLHYAVLSNKKDIIKWFIDKEADQNIRNNEGKKALPFKIDDVTSPHIEQTVGLQGLVMWVKEPWERM